MPSSSKKSARSKHAKSVRSRAKTKKTVSKVPFAYHIVIQAAAALIIAVGLGYFARIGIDNAQRSNATTAAKSFIADLNAGNSVKAYKMASSAVHNNNTQLEFAEKSKELKTDSPRLTNEAIIFSGDKAFYSVYESGLATAESGTDGSGIFMLTLVKYGLFGWKVDSATLQ